MAVAHPEPGPGEHALRRRALGFSCIVFLVTAMASPALAVCGSCPVCARPWLVRASHAETRDTIVHSIEAAAARIVATIQDSTQILTETEQRSLEALERIADAQEALAMQRERQRQRARAEGGRYDPGWSACEIVTVGTDARPVAAQPVAREEREPDTASGRARLFDTRQRLCLDENGTPDLTMPACQGDGAVARDIITAQEDMAGLGGWRDPTSEIEVVLGNPTSSIPGVEQDRVDEAIERLGANILHPFPEPPLTTADDTIEGRREQARRIADEARRSAPRALWGWIADFHQPRYPADRLRNMSGIDPNADIPDQVSEREFYELLVASRFRNPEWHLRMAQASPEAVTRETLAVLALQADIAWMQFEMDLHRAAAEVADTAASLDP